MLRRSHLASRLAFLDCILGVVLRFSSGDRLGSKVAFDGGRLAHAVFGDEEAVVLERNPNRLTLGIAGAQGHPAALFLTDAGHLAGHFDVFRIFDQGLAFAREHHTPLPPFIDQVQTEMQQIETAFQRAPLSLVASHNDLLPANFLLDNDGRIWLLDWEYAGWGDPFFDLGNLSVNNEFGDAQDAALLTAYFGEVTATHLARLKLMKIVSDAREGIWAMVQQSISELEFDFAAYGNQHLERFMNNCAAPEAPQWLAILQQ